MDKTTVYLTTEQKAALAAAARDQGRSEARLIRDGIDRVLAGHQVGENLTPLASDEAARMAPDVAPLSRPRWVGREAFVALIGSAQADADLEAELRGLAPDQTDSAAER